MRIRSLCVAVLISATATAQYASDFEALTPGVLTGQDGYYLPAGTMSVDFDVQTYAGSPLGVPANPTGGLQFIAGTGPASPTFARAQRDIAYGGGGATWVLGFDILATYTGTLPSAQNLGSVSMQPFPGSQSLIALARWTDPATAANWNADYVWFDSAGTQLTESVADPGFQNLAVNTWYRWETVVSLDTNQVLEVRITDIVAGTTVSHNPVGRYMEGGTAGSATPTGFRFFAGGGVAGNTLAFDNASIAEFISDTCAEAVPVGNGMNGPFDSTTATTSMPAWSTCATSGGADRWFSYTADCTGIVTAKTCGATFDTVMEAFSGDCSTLTLLECNDDDHCGFQSRVRLNVTPGTTYLLRVGGFSGASGSFPLTIDCNPPLPNDECSGAIPVALGPNGPFNNNGATTSLPAWCVSTAGNDLWFSHVAQCSTVVASTCGADFDTAMEVFDGCGTLVSLACNDDTCFRQSEVMWAATPGTTYYIRVGGWSEDTGSFPLNLGCDFGITFEGVAEAAAGTGTLSTANGPLFANDFLRWNYNDPGSMYAGFFAVSVLNFGPSPLGTTVEIPGFYQLWTGSTPSGFAAMLPPHIVGSPDHSFQVPPGILTNGQVLRLQGAVLDPMNAPGSLPVVPTNNTTEFRYVDCAVYEGFDGLATGLGVYPAGWADGGGTQQWRVDDNGTPSGGTGPAAGFSLPNYMYCETSSPAAGGDTYIMNTAVYPSAGLSNLEFRLSRNGESVGKLEVRMGDGSGTFPTLLARYTGPALHDASYWSLESIPLGGSLPANIQLQFHYTHATDFTGDIAIDDVCLR